MDTPLPDRTPAQELKIELVRIEHAAEKAGLRVEMTICYGGEELHVNRVQGLLSGLWRMSCFTADGQESYILCYPLSFPIRFKFHPKDAPHPAHRRQLGFQADPEPEAEAIYTADE